MNTTFGIKLASSDVPAKACMSIKKITGLSLGEIKQRAENGDYIFECDVVDDEGLKLISKLKRELKKQKVATKLFGADEEIESHLLDNLEKMYEEIDRDNY